MENIILDKNGKPGFQLKYQDKDKHTLGPEPGRCIFSRWILYCGYALKDSRVCKRIKHDNCQCNGTEEEKFECPFWQVKNGKD